MKKFYPERIYFEQFDRTQCRRAFGLIEVVISAGILAMFLGALMGLVAAGTQTSVSSERRLVAVNLAREGIEATRQARDTAWQRGDSWSAVCYGLGAGLKYPQYSNSCGNYQLVDITGGQMEELNPQGVHQGNVSPPYSSIGVENYARSITLVDIPGSTNEVKRITVRVLWIEKGRERDIQMVSYLTNWRP